MIFQRLHIHGTSVAYEKLINQQVDLILVTEPSNEILTSAKEKQVDLEIIPVVREAFVFLVNKENPIKNLSLDQIRKIYSGQITNWSQVGGNQETIKALQRKTNSGSQTGLTSLIMKNTSLIEAKKEDQLDTTKDMIERISDSKKGKSTIGYAYYYETLEQENDKIQILNINGIEPNYEAIKNQSYPIETVYYIVIRKSEPESSNVRKLVEAMLSKKGQEIAKEAGYVPLTARKQKVKGVVK